MPFMQETPRSLRAYLILVGLIGALAQLPGVLSDQVGPLGRLLSLVGVAVAVGYAWAGVSFNSLIVTNSRRIEQILIAGLAYSILIAVIIVLFAPLAAEAGGAIVRGIGGFLITLYLLNNVRRLARETRGPPPAPGSGSAA